MSYTAFRTGLLFGGIAFAYIGAGTAFGAAGLTMVSGLFLIALALAP